MYLGRIVEQAETGTLFSQPRHPYTRALLDSVLTIEPGVGIPDAGLGGAYPNPLDPPSGCAFHPRCPHANERCRRERPVLLAAGSRTMAACHAVEEGRIAAPV
jgi:peptide/nickel transport system ATP-binding protein